MLSIFMDAATKRFSYEEVIHRNDRFFDASGNRLWPTWVIKAEELEAFLELPDKTVLALKGVDTGHHPRRLMKAEISSIVVFDSWRDEGMIPVIAWLKRDSNDRGKFVYEYSSSSTDRWAQDFWEAMYPSDRERIIAKVNRSLFMTDQYYFVGTATGKLYTVFDTAGIAGIFLYDVLFVGKDYPYYDAKERGILDGLDQKEFRNTRGTRGPAGFGLGALKGTAYTEQKITDPEGLIALAHSNSNINWVLERILTKEELELLQS